MFIGTAIFISLVLLSKIAYFYAEGGIFLAFGLLCMFSVQMEFVTRNMLLLLCLQYSYVSIKKTTIIVF